MLDLKASNLSRSHCSPLLGAARENMCKVKHSHVGQVGLGV